MHPPTFSVENDTKVYVGSVVRATCSTPNSTVTITGLDEAVVGEEKAGYAEVTIPEKCLNHLLGLYATATVEGEDGPITSTTSEIQVDVVEAPKVISDVLKQDENIFNFSNSYSLMSYTSPSTKVSYYGKALKSNGMQINTGSKSSDSNYKCGIISEENPDGLIIESVKVAGNVEKVKMAFSNVKGSHTGTVGETGKSVYVEGASDGVDVTGELNAEKTEAIFRPTSEFKYFTLTTTGSQQISSVEVFYYKPAVVESEMTEVALSWLDEPEAEYTVGQENVMLGIVVEPAEAENDVVVTADPASAVSVEYEDGFAILTFNEACENVTITASIPATNDTYESNVLTANFTVVENIVKVATPVAKVNGVVLEDESEIFVNDLIELSCTTPGANISYVIDGADNDYDEVDDNCFKFTKEDVYTIIVFAEAEGLEDSDYLEITIYVNKRTPELSLSADAAVAYLDNLDDFETPVLYNPSNLKVTYTSSDPDIATVDNEGQVNPLSEGSAVISVSFAGNGEYEGLKEALSYTLTVYAVTPQIAYTTHTFDFKEETYGMIRQDGSSQTYNEDEVTIFNDDDTEVLSIYVKNGENGKTRLWSDGWRFHRGSKISNNNYNPCSYTMKISSSEYSITEISFAGDLAKSATFSAVNGYDSESSTWKGNSNVVDFTITTTENKAISSINVTFGHDVVPTPFAKFAAGDLHRFTLIHEKDDHNIFYKIEKANTEQGLARAMNHGDKYSGFTQYSGGELSMADDEKISIYAQHPHGMVSDILTASYADIATGVVNITADDDEVVYFNLQGVRVAEPASGVYIRVANGKASKIVK